MKKFRKVMAAAIAMLTLSTAAAVTGTVDWFTSSNVVTASGMSIEAEAEQGILISNEDATKTWAESAEASHDGGTAKFIPTSTADTVTWYHANAAEYDSHVHTGEYTSYTGNAISNNDGVYYVSLNNVNKNIYLKNDFYVKSSTPGNKTGETLYVNRVTGSLKAGGTAASGELDKALRFVVVYDSAVLVYAPFENDQELAAYTVNGTTSITPLNEDNVELKTGVTIPGSETADASTLKISTFVYFEGEDVHCKSSNIKATLDRLAIEVKFGTEELH